ncbi:MAG TPA: hypothetical protein VFC19_37590 [Candidatus Limnocylindrales bacterium]|nr:hypothetical protein [Candidatus Limnocylindrales bacterium]
MRDKLLGRLILVLLPPHWGEAVVSEAEHVEPGWSRTLWLAGGVLAAVKEGVMSIRWGAWAAIAATMSLVAFTFWRYPVAFGGGGGPLYDSLIAVLLLGYAVATWWVTRQSGAGVRWGTRFGVAAAAVAALASMPYGLSPVAHAALLGVPVLLAFAAMKALRDNGSPVQAMIAGGWGGGIAALAAFLCYGVMAVAAPERLPIDPSVASRHSGADLIAANLGEQSVVYILGLAGWPMVGLLSAAFVTIAAGSKRHGPNAA